MLKLKPRQVEKPWGRCELPAPFRNRGDGLVGEIWFEDPEGRDLPFLVKYIFTSERLSVQVHPDDAQAAATGQIRGKTECWYILDSDPGAEIGIGLNRDTSPEELRYAALDGSIMDLLDWRTVAPGDFFYVPAGTVHAIGAGVSLLEFQQNSDITYRLFDYGRPRELHLDEAVAVADPSPYDQSRASSATSADAILHSGSDFTFLRASGDDVAAALENRRRWVMPIAGEVRSGRLVASAGECLLLEPGEPLQIREAATTMIGAAGSI